MKLDMYIIDAFAERALTGNPAAVCPLDAWIAEETMQAIAQEMNLAETAFIVGRGRPLRFAHQCITVQDCVRQNLGTIYKLAPRRR